MFSCNLVQRGHCSLAKPPTARRCGAIGRVLAQAAGSTGQISSTIHRSLPGESAAAGRRGVAVGAAAARRSQDGAWTARQMDSNEGLTKGLKKNVVMLVGRWDLADSTAVVHRHGGTSIADVNAAVHVPSRKVGEAQQQYQLRPGVGASAAVKRGISCGGGAGVRLDRRWFSAGKGPDSGSGSASDTDSAEAGQGREGSPSTGDEAAPSATSATPAKKIPKPRKPRKRRVGKGEREGEAETATQAAAVAVEGEAEEAPAKTVPKPRKPRKRRSAQGESDPSSTAESVAPADSKASAAAEKEEREPPVKISAERKESFQRARRAGVAQRAKEGAGSSGEGSSQSSGGEGSESSDEAPFPYKEAKAPPYTWQDPDTPVRPKEFLAGVGGSSEGGESGAAADGEKKDSTTSPSRGKVRHIGVATAALFSGSRCSFRWDWVSHALRVNSRK